MEEAMLEYAGKYKPELKTAVWLGFPTSYTSANPVPLQWHMEEIHFHLHIEYFFHSAFQFRHAS